jgi:23S rRNA pseudouridine1911/1915/1917 synthase
MNSKEARIIQLEVEDTQTGKRVDKYLSEKLKEFSREFIKKLIKEQKIKINSQPIKKTSYKIQKGDIIEVEIPLPKKTELKPQYIPLEIIYEDEDIAVIVKPPGLVVHPSPGHEENTLVNALLYHFKNLSSIGGEERPGIVHRLDRGTAGLMVIAKNDYAHRKLSEQFQKRITEKRYLALVVPHLKNHSHGIIEAPIGRSIYDRKKFSVFSNKVREAKTEYFVKETFPSANSTLLELKIYTGRTHQIRVHLKTLNVHIWGDYFYGFKENMVPEKYRELLKLLPENSFWLVAYLLGFYHPRKGKWLQFQINPPKEYLEILQKLRNS